VVQDGTRLATSVDEPALVEITVDGVSMALQRATSCTAIRCVAVNSKSRRSSSSISLARGSIARRE
jgi:hypothetical protein